MIHAHHFYFVDQPRLQKEYESFGFESENKNTTQMIRVEEIEEYPGFEYRRGLRYMSGRACYYLSNRAFEEMDEEDDWGLEILNVLSLVWDSKKRRILYGRGKDFTPELLQFWIFHTFFPVILELEGEYKMLHVGAVEVSGGPVLFAAPSFGGKSTMTDFFIRKGHTLFSDDALAVKKKNDSYVVYPSFPYHRPYRQPEVLGYRAENFAREPTPIKALFDLHPVMPDAPVEISIPKGIEKFKAFFYSNFINFPFMKKERFDFFTQMSLQVPVFKVSVPWDKDRLDEVYETIVKKTQDLQN
jgi:hypothetical protein